MIDAKDSYNCTGLIRAADRGYVEIVWRDAVSVGEIDVNTALDE